MNKSAWAITKLNLKNMKVPYLTTGILVLAMLIQDIIKVSMAANGMDIGDQISVSTGNLIWIFIPLAAIFIASKNFRRIINLGGKRSHYFMGCLLTYLILSAVVSLAGVLIFRFYDALITSTGTFGGIWNLLEIWGWTSHGLFIAFIQQFVFLFLVAVFTHTLTAMQGSWYGWVVDIIIAAIIAVFTPIAPLRMNLYTFFRGILFHPSAMLQIVNCVVLAAVLYAVSYPVVSKKRL